MYIIRMMGGLGNQMFQYAIIINHILEDLYLRRRLQALMKTSINVEKIHTL